MAASGSQTFSAGSTTRAFAQKLNKFRRNGSATFSTQSSTRSQSSTSSSFIHLAAGTTVAGLGTTGTPSSPSLLVL